eukprot:1591890-Rhodomonas_salina.1
MPEPTEAAEQWWQFKVPKEHEDRDLQWAVLEMGIMLDQFHADTQHVYTWPEISVKQAETGLTLEMYDRSPKQLK